MAKLIKQMAAMALAGLMLAGCGTPANSNTPADAPQNTAAANTNTETKQSEQPASVPAPTFDVTKVEEFDILMLGGLSDDLSDMDDMVGKAITEKTGVKLNFEFPVGDWAEKLALVIAGGDYPDLIGNKDNAITQLVEAKALVGLRDKIMSNAPNIVSYIGDKINRLTYSIDDPEFYGFGSANNYNEPTPGEYWGVGFGLQHDVVIQAGFPEVKDLQDYEKLIADYKAANPEINGQPAIGVSLIAADGWRWKISVTNPAFLANGKPDDGEWFVNTDTFQAEFHYKDPNEKEYFRWLNHMNDIGLLDPESFTQSYDAYQAKISSGRVIGVIDALWSIDIARREAREVVGEERDFILFPVLVDPATQNWSSERSSGGVDGGGIMVTTACKNVDKIVNFFDFLASDEGQLLKKCGIEGVHYDMIDGVRVTNPEVKAIRLDPNQTLEFRKTSGIGRYNSIYTPGRGYVTANGIPLDDPFDDTESWESYTESQRTVLDGYGVRGFNMLYPSSSEVTESPFGAAWTLAIGKTEDTEVILKKAEEITLKAIARAVLAKPAEFDAEWDKFMKEIEDINIALLEAEVTALVAERMQLWGY